MWMCENQSDEMQRLGLPFQGLFGRPLHAIDCQGLFCETDKYCREAVPELASARSRIKARFNQSTAPLRLYFPPQWGVNDMLPDPVAAPEGLPAPRVSSRQCSSCRRRGAAERLKSVRPSARPPARA